MRLGSRRLLRRVLIAIATATLLTIGVLLIVLDRLGSPDHGICARNLQHGADSSRL